MKALRVLWNGGVQCPSYRCTYDARQNCGLYNGKNESGLECNELFGSIFYVGAISDVLIL
jgi:hypothetical protein